MKWSFQLRNKSSPGCTTSLPRRNQSGGRHTSVRSLALKSPSHSGRNLDNFHAQGPPETAFPVILIRLLTCCWGRLQQCSVSNPCITIAGASHTTLPAMTWLLIHWPHDTSVEADEAHPQIPSQYHRVYFRDLCVPTILLASPANGEFHVLGQWDNTSFQVSPSRTVPTEVPSE